MAINPMLCEPSEPETLESLSQDWLWEIKLDGDRAILFIENGKVIVQNRKMLDVTYRYPELQRIGNGRNAVLDGEIVVFKDNKTDFELLSQRTHLQNKLDIEIRMKSIPVTFVAFDCLECDGEDLKGKTLLERKEILYANFAPVVPVFQYNLTYGLDGQMTAKALFEETKRLDLEGIVGKHVDSPYLEGKRSAYWRKVKNVKTVDMVFMKYTVNPAGIRLESQDGIAVQCSGAQSKLVKHLIDSHGGVVVEVKYLNKTKYGKLRMPTFKALKGGVA